MSGKSARTSADRRSAWRRRAPNPVKRRIKRALSWLTLVFLSAFLLASVYFGVLLYRADQTIQSIYAISARAVSEPTIFVSSDGVRLAEFRTAYQAPAKLEEIPKHLQNATIAAEDRRFWQHSGVDPIAMVRAGWSMLKGGSLQGGSTLAQQLAKRLFTTQERTIGRKLQDMALAIQLERRLTKQQILQLYLNQVYYGGGAYGVKAAADIYFDKPLDRLTLGECALLARLPRRPSTENPFVNEEAALRNRDVVLDLMLEQGLIRADEAEAAKREKPRFARKRPTLVSRWQAPYAVAEAMRELRGVMDPEQLYAGGYRVELTIDMRMQAAAEAALADALRQYRRRGVTEGAAMVMDTNGRTLVMIGGSSFGRSQFNVITQGQRQPGSSFKPLMYAVGFELGILGPEERVSDSKRSYPTGVPGRFYTPSNADGRYMGNITVRTALRLSRNCAAVYANSLIGPRRAAEEITSRFGFRSRIEPVLSLPLGASAVRPIEMVEAFSTFATGGTRVRPYIVERVLTPEGVTVHRGSAQMWRGAISVTTAQAMDSILRDAVTRGTGSGARSVEGARGKTGTTSDHRDAWFIGYAGNHIGVVWVGNPLYDENAKRWMYRPMPGIYGGTVPVAVWARMMNGVIRIAGSPDRREPETDGQHDKVVVTVCEETGQVATKYCPSSVRRSFVQGTQPTSRCPVHIGHDEPVVTVDEPEARTGVEPGVQEVPPVGRDRGEVTIWICAESGRPANAYCPEAIPRRFSKDRVPPGLCDIHGPGRPR